MEQRNASLHLPFAVLLSADRKFDGEIVIGLMPVTTAANRCPCYRSGMQRGLLPGYWYSYLWNGNQMDIFLLSIGADDGLQSVGGKDHFVIHRYRRA